MFPPHIPYEEARKYVIIIIIIIIIIIFDKFKLTRTTCFTFSALNLSSKGPIVPALGRSKMKKLCTPTLYNKNMIRLTYWHKGATL